MSQTTIADRLAEVCPGEPQGAAVLQVIPLKAPSHQKPEYRLLEADVFERVTVTEVSESGNVPVLLVHNSLDVPVFLMDGQELIGAKQNRISNADVLVPALTKLEIPVSCVEAGRWSYRSSAFTPGKAASSTMRQRKAVRVHDSLIRGEGFDANQQEVWNDVAESLGEAGCSSPTGALHDAYEARRKEIDTLRQSFNLPDDAVGIAVCREGRIAGLDLFDRVSTLKYFWESLVDGYLIELLGSESSPSRSRTMNKEATVDLVAETMRQAASNNWKQFNSPGIGRDYRLQSEGLTGMALVCDDETVVHLQLFPRDPNMSEGNRSHRRGRIHRRYLSPPEDNDS